MNAINRTLGNTPATSGLTSEPDTAEEVEVPRHKHPAPDYYNPPYDPADPSEPLYTKSGVRLVTLDELAAHGHSAIPQKPIWLAMMGKVFNVDKGAEHYYGPNGGYKFFSGDTSIHMPAAVIPIRVHLF